jgi:hypothetical protein
MNESNASNGPAIQLRLDASIGESHLMFATSSLTELARVMALFNLVEATPGNGQAAAPAAAPKAPKAPKAETPAPAPAATAPAPAATVPAPAQAASASASSVTPEMAAAAVREYGGKNGIEAARALLQKHGVDKTANITAEKAPAIHAEATGAAADL